MRSKAVAMSFSVNLRTSEFAQRRLVKGPIWLEIDGQEFPIDGWYDFPVVILGWWLCNMKPLLADRAIKCECAFMDGPYKYEIAVQKQSGWTLTCIKDDLNGEKRLLRKEIDPKLLVSEVLSSANIVINLCKEKGWESDDLLTLMNEAEEVKKLIQHLP
jgi:hypothetical protein